jgi:hypothetical protein
MNAFEGTCESFFERNLYSNLIEIKSAELEPCRRGLSKIISAITIRNSGKAFRISEMRTAGNPKIPT